MRLKQVWVNNTMSKQIKADVLVAGGGLAGIVTALELLRAGKTVAIVDKDTPDRFGGLALWAFGGMALVGTSLQSSRGIKDSPELALKDWMSFGELADDDYWPKEWAQYYVKHSNDEVFEWLKQEGVKFMPAVNLVERGMNGDGNSVARYHIVWGTSRELVRVMIAALKQANKEGRLTLLHQHTITSVDYTDGKVVGAFAIDDKTGADVYFQSPTVVLAMGGINGSHAECRANWPKDRAIPETMLNGAHPFADGKLHHWVNDHLGGQITHAGEMWNYAAGFPHPYPHFEGHGLSTIPCKSALWLNHRGERIGPEPLVTGFDTHWLCQRVAEQEKPWTWHLLNWRIAAKEFAISGAEHNPRIRDKQFVRFVVDTLMSNDRLVKQMQSESPYFIVAETLEALAEKMNSLTATLDIDPAVLKATANAFDANFKKGANPKNDKQIARILKAREWKPDALRTCKPAPLQKKEYGPFIAIHMQLITRKSLGGLKTDLQSRVLDAQDKAIDGLYCVGEAAGFGGGGASGKRSLEGTFLPGCVLTARAAARSIISGK